MGTIVIDPGHGGDVKVGGSSPNNARGPSGVLEKALTLFARQSPVPDLVVSDVMMPRLDGFALADELLVRAPGTRVLLMSGYAGADASSRPGREPLLVKPFTPDALLDRVRALLAV